MSSLRTKLVEVEEADGEAELDPFAPLDQTQSITLESMKRAYHYHASLPTSKSLNNNNKNDDDNDDKNEVLIVAALYPHDLEVLEPYFESSTRRHGWSLSNQKRSHSPWCHTVPLNRSTATVFPELQPQKELPFVDDILQGAMTYAASLSIPFEFD